MAWKEKYEIHHGVRIKTSRWLLQPSSPTVITDRFLPDKAIDLMDEAASRLRIEIDSMPEEVDLAERKLTQMQIEEQALMKETDEPSRERLEASARRFPLPVKRWIRRRHGRTKRTSLSAFRT